MRKYVRTSSFVLVSRPWLQSRRSSFSILFTVTWRKRKKREKKKKMKRIKKEEEEEEEKRVSRPDDRSRARHEAAWKCASFFQGRGYRETAEVWPINIAWKESRSGAITIRLTGARFLLLLLLLFFLINRRGRRRAINKIIVEGTIVVSFPFPFFPSALS